MKNNNKGFSLVELIVVIAIMAILAAVAVVGFSLYIPKAQQASDKQMVGDIEYAFELNAYDYPDGVADYVIITTNGASAKAGGFADEALTASFGANWRNELKLAYGEWASDSSVLSTALNATNVSGSSYIQNSSVSELLGNVQDVTSAAAGLLGSKTGTADEYLGTLQLLGNAYMESAVAAGVIGKNGDGQYYLFEGTYTDGVGPTEALQNQLSNLMVFDVANQMTTVESEDMAFLMISGVSDVSENIDTQQYPLPTVMAAQYALYKAYVADHPEAAASFELMNQKMQGVQSASAAQGALEEFVETNKDGLTAYIDGEQGAATLENNASAVTQIMKGVTAAAPDYTNADTLNNSSLFTSDAVSGELNVFVGMASVELDPEQRTALSEILASNPNAVVVMIYNGEIISTVN